MNRISTTTAPELLLAPVSFSGTLAKLSEIVRRATVAIKSIDPAVKIISPSITGWSTKPGQSAETYFTGMMAAPTGDGSTTMKDWVDIIAVHLTCHPIAQPSWCL